MACMIVAGACPPCAWAVARPARQTRHSDDDRLTWHASRGQPPYDSCRCSPDAVGHMQLQGVHQRQEDKSLTLSVSISASTSPAANSSPSLFFHEAMLPCKQHQACQPACIWTHTRIECESWARLNMLGVRGQARDVGDTSAHTAVGVRST